MSWAKLDDGFPESPKVVGLSDRAFRVHVRALCYAAAHLTDGRVPAAKVTEWGIKSAKELVDAGLWAESTDAYAIHDYLDYNPSADAVKEERRKARERRSKGGRRSPDVRPNDINPVPSRPQPVELPTSAPRTQNQIDAELLLDSSARPQYLLGKLRDVDPSWAKVTPARLMGLSKQFGPAIVISAVEFISETKPALTDSDPYGYLQTVCRSRKEAS